MSQGLEVLMLAWTSGFTHSKLQVTHEKKWRPKILVFFMRPFED